MIDKFKEIIKKAYLDGGNKFADVDFPEESDFDEWWEDNKDLTSDYKHKKETFAINNEMVMDDLKWQFNWVLRAIKKGYKNA